MDWHDGTCSRYRAYFHAARIPEHGEVFRYGLLESSMIFLISPRLKRASFPWTRSPFRCQTVIADTMKNLALRAPSEIG